MDSSISLQGVILRLQEYWTQLGCVLWQPYHTELGAGTMNPATALRVLGPEPWRVAYVEPSIRPADGRYGENPNRWQMFYQFQVILKPDPGNPQELYLDSLVSLGIDPLKHDIRFVEDNWESPALGAWGLGWEVWLDGQEITQFTYFQQSGGHMLDPVSVEITYGIERILQVLQGADTFQEIAWSSDYTYGELSHQAEVEHCRYNFETADIERLHDLFENYRQEAESALSHGLLFPAHDLILKCSHLFNLLDARGAIGVTERAALFGKMRELSRGVADTYVAQRKEQGFPWLDKVPKDAREVPSEDTTVNVPTAAAPFLLEVGTEELPTADLDGAVEQLDEAILRLLQESHLEHGQVKVMGTPRRLVVYVEDLAPEQSERVTVVKGPPAERAFDEAGNPTKAAEGFARSREVPVDSLTVQDLDGGKYVVAEVRERGLSADEVLGQQIPALLADLRFEKSMRWDGTGLGFSRPVRWLLALHGGHVVPMGFAGLRAGRLSRNLRFADPEAFSVPEPAGYFAAMEGQGIILDIGRRREVVLSQSSELAESVGGALRDDPELLAEVANLVEAPTALMGRFDETFLSLPRDVLVSVMKEHQRYFPVEKEGELAPYFVALSNGGQRHLDVITRGNEQVIRARFADAAFFIEQDMEQPLESYLPRLSSLTFQSRLGSVADKVDRIQDLVSILSAEFGLEPAARRTAMRVAALCKADMATRMVVEMTSLQGVIGREYALRSGESPEVAEGILEHHLPRASGDRLPETLAGMLVGIADRMDSLMGLFAVGMQPTGTRDPFALRRAAIGLVQILVEKDLRLDLGIGLGWASNGLNVPVPPGTLLACLEFLVTRQQMLLLADGYRHDTVDAVLAAQGKIPASAARAVVDLERWIEKEDWLLILHAFARSARIVRGEEATYPVDKKLFSEPAEKELFADLEMAEAKPRDAGSVDDMLAAFEPMVPAVNRFFDDVLVMTEDQSRRENRLGLLQRVVALADGVADFSRLEGF